MSGFNKDALLSVSETLFQSSLSGRLKEVIEVPLSCLESCNLFELESKVLDD
jgi:hypothetical protein